MMFISPKICFFCHGNRNECRFCCSIPDYPTLSRNKMKGAPAMIIHIFIHTGLSFTDAGNT
uniref:Uncharacterized protein n=1 Tax=Octopus bimaculoides TaxID=37653 RepID=A0A0L8G8C8_OCTBM